MIYHHLNTIHPADSITMPLFLVDGLDQDLGLVGDELRILQVLKNIFLRSLHVQPGFMSKSRERRFHPGLGCMWSIGSDGYTRVMQVEINRYLS